MRTLIVVSSRHHQNTDKVASAMADVLGAEVKRPQQTDPGELREYDLVGFGSGIDSDRHYRPLLDLADGLPRADGRKAFIFSTCGIPLFAAGEGVVVRYAARSHAALREILVSKCYVIVGEFTCAGFNTNSFLRLLGGVNKGRPNAADLGRARSFAGSLVPDHSLARSA